MKTTTTSFRRFITVIALWALVGSVGAAPAKVEFSPSSKSVEVFDYFEATLKVDRPDAPHPFMDVTVLGQCARAGEPAVRMDGFCDAADGSVSRVRFMPVKLGTHSHKVEFQQAGFSQTFTGSFDAKAGGRPGPVRVDPAYPFHFIREGTDQHWFWNATTAYQLLAWDEDTIARSVNRLRVALAGRTKDGRRWNEPLVVPTARFVLKNGTLGGRATR